jgi:hypothetical protein
MFRRLWTARRMKARYSRASSSRSNCVSVSSKASVARRVLSKSPRWASSSSDQTWLEGRRMVIATQPAVVAGGSTIWMRSPLGSDADSRGDSSAIRCRVELATSLANLRHHSKSANGSGSRCHPSRVSMKASPGVLIHSSVTSDRESSGRRARKVRSSADDSGAARGGSALADSGPANGRFAARTACASRGRADSMEGIHAPEV